MKPRLQVKDTQSVRDVIAQPDFGSDDFKGFIDL